MPTLWASIAQLVEHALRKRTGVGSIPTGGFSALCSSSAGLVVYFSIAGNAAPSEEL